MNRSSLYKLIVVFLLFNSSPSIFAQNFEWTEAAGANSTEVGKSVAVDQQCNVYSTGFFTGTVTFDPGGPNATQLTAFNNDAFVQKLAPNGDLLWAASFGSTFQDQGISVDVDQNGNVYVIGRYRNTVDFDPGPGVANLSSPGAYSTFILKLNTNGGFLWVRSLASGDGTSVKVGPNGDVYVAGNYTGGFDANPGAGVFPLPSTGPYSLFVVKLNTNGNFIWATSTEGGGYDWINGIDVDANGNVYGTGDFGGTVDFDFGSNAVNLTANGFRDIFTIKFDQNGVFQWVRQMGSNQFDEGLDIAADDLGNVFTTGRYSNNANFNLSGPPATLNSNGVRDVFVHKMDDQGTFIWVQGFGGPSDDFGYGIDTDLSGDVYITGNFSGTVDFDPGVPVNNVTAFGSSDIFILKLLTSGAFSYVHQLGGTSTDNSNDIFLDDLGSIFTTGSFRGSADFDPSAGTATSTSNGQDDLFVHKMSLPTSAPVVTANQPNLFLCCPSTPINIGLEYIPTGNVWWTNNFFSPSGGPPTGPVGGQFLNLPPCGVTTQQFGNFRLYKFDPCLCAPGTYQLEYGYTDACGNTGSAIMDITTGNGPNVSFNPLLIDLCNTTTPVPIVPVTNGTSCQITGAFVNPMGEFDAQAAGIGTHTIQITCSDVNGCTTTITGTIIVTGLSVSVNHVGPFCENDPPVQLTSNPTGLVGSWTGPGVSVGGIFDPSLAGPGNHTITFNATSGSCTASGQSTITVYPAPQVSALQTNLDLCCGSTPSNPVFLGISNLQTNNTYSPYFTPFQAPLNQAPGGQFAQLPSAPCLTTNFGLGYAWYSLDACNCAPGTYPLNYEFTDQNGCSETATMNINILSGPTVSFPPMTIDLCTYTGPVPINPITSGGNCQVTGQYVNTMGEFDALAAGIGTHTVQITCTTGTGCSTTITGTITVVQDGLWHNTTSQTVAPTDKGDVGVDIYTDDQGYVYSTGYFYHQTTFDDQFGNIITISNPVGPENKKFFTVCYSDCGELQWVIYDDFQLQSHWSEGFGIGKNQDDLFIGFNYSPEATFTTVYPSGLTVSSTVIASGNANAIGNAAVLSIHGPNSGALFGQINDIEDAYRDVEGKALFARPTTGNVMSMYICGRSDYDNNAEYSVFYAQLLYNTGPNSLNAGWTRNSLDESTKHVANDIKWDQALNRILMTGSFAEDIVLQTNTGTASQSTLASTDAFFVTIRPNGAIFGPTLLKLGIDANGTAMGTTLTSNDNSYLYFGGVFNGTVQSPFSPIFGLPPATSNSTGGFSSYLFAYDLSLAASSFEEIWNTGSQAILTGIDANSNEVIFTGYYGPGIPQTNLATNAGVNPSTWANLVFVGQLDLVLGNWSVPEIVNSTITNTPTDFDQRSGRIAIGNNGDGYLTGRYRENLSYFFTGTPASPDLNSTAVGPFIHNAFFIRNELSTNALRTAINPTYSIASEDIFDTKDVVEENKTPEIVAVPNPTRGEVLIQIENYVVDRTFLIEVYNPLGELIMSGKESSSNFRIDLSAFEDGVYILKIFLSGEVKEVRIVKA